MNLFNVLIKPVLSEKSVECREKHQKYTFLVERKSSKTEIKKAIETVFEVQVQSINTCITRGKVRRRGAVVSLDSAKKKAIVTLKPGHKIKMFEDQ